MDVGLAKQDAALGIQPAGHQHGRGVEHVAGQRAGVTTLAGADNLTAQAVLFATADHPVIGEDLFAGGAYVGGRPEHMGSLAAQDAMRLIIGVAIILGVIGKTLGLF